MRQAHGLSIADGKDLSALLIARIANAAEERLHGVFFDASGEYIGDETLATGTRDLAYTRARDLFARALAANASAVIIAHNHPSGLCYPSPDDIRATNRIRSIGGALDVELLDHLIITRDQAYSMRMGAFL